MKTKHTFCRICEPHCPLIAGFDDDDRLIQLSPDPGHPSGGIACHKGLSFLDIHRDPDRVNWPQRRENPRSEARGVFADCDWDGAMTDIGERLTAVRERYGPDAVAVYIGNPWAFNAAGLLMFFRFADTLSTRMRFGVNTQDTANKFLAAGEIYGSTASLMTPDLQHTDYLLCLGANPKVSRWTMVSVPNDAGEVLKQIRRRGGKICFVNPREVESSTAETGPTLRIKPGTDVYFLAALLNEIDIRGGFDEAVVARYGKHVEALRTFCRHYPASRVAPVIGLDAMHVEQVACDMMAARSAAAYMATGLNQSQQGILCYWLVEMINFVTGNLGRRGGTYKPNGLRDECPPLQPPARFKTSLGTFELPEPMGFAGLPAALLPDFIDRGDIRAIINLGGNPLLTVAGGEAMRRAIGKLELMVSVDIFRNATGELSDYVLPATDWLERMDINLLSNGMQAVPYVQYTDAMEEAAQGRRHAWWILARMMQAMRLPSPLDDDPGLSDGVDEINGMLSAKNLSIDKLRNVPRHTVTFKREDPGALYEHCLRHADRRIDCFPESFVRAGLFDRCSSIFSERSREPEHTLRLISMRTPYMQNSWFSNTRRFRHGRHGLNPLNLCEADAAARGLCNGDAVRVFNSFGSIEARVCIDDTLRPGAVAMTHGYGHRHAYGLRVAASKPGSNCNELMPTGATTFEPLSYMSWISGVPVEVERIDMKPE